MQTTIDKFGRIVIPKRLRQIHGLTPGTRVDIEDRPESVEIRPHQEEPPLVRINGRLVHTGKLPDDFDLREFVKAQRHERAEKVAGMKLDPDE